MPMKEKFTKQLQKLMDRKKSSAFFIDPERYQEFIRELNHIKTKEDKNFNDFKLLSLYDVIIVNNKERLIRPRDEINKCTKFYVSTDELFGVLHTMHLLFKHADMDVMDREIKVKYCNISKEVIKMYLNGLKIMVSQEGRSLMKLGDFTFTKILCNGNRWCWSCYTHNDHGCEARIYTDQNILVYAKNHHNHPPTEFFV